MDGVCDEVVLQPRDGELTVEERFFDGLLEAVCSSVVSVFSPVSDQTLVEQGFGGAEGSRTPDLVKQDYRCTILHLPTLRFTEPSGSMT